MKTQIKLKDIAEYTGVTASTVSAALAGKGRISPATRKIVSDAARELGYKPNWAAKLLKGNSGTALGLVISDSAESLLANSAYSNVLEHFLRECKQEGIKPLFEMFNPEKHKSSLPEMFTDGLATGVLHIGYIPESTKKWLKKYPEYPFVAFEEPWEYSVRTDNVKGLLRAMEHIAAKGKRKPALMCGPTKFDIHKQTLKGFKKGVTEFGMQLNPEWIIEQTSFIEQKQLINQRLAALKFLLNNRNRPDSLIISGPTIYIALTLLAERGIRIPQDISVICICDSNVAENVFPMITSIERNTKTMSIAALRMLSQRIKSIVPENKKIWIEPVFKQRNST